MNKYTLHAPGAKGDETVRHNAGGPSGGNEKILLVDDDVHVITLLQLWLERLGYAVVPIQDSQEAWALLQSDPDQFDLLLTDMIMPLLTGTELAKKAMTVRPELPVILCTGYSYMIDEKATREMRIAAFVVKPVRLSKLAGIIRKVLDKSS